MQLDIFEHVHTSTVTGPTTIRIAFESEDFDAAKAACYHHREKYPNAVISTGATRVIRGKEWGFVFILVLNRFIMDGEYGNTQPVPDRLVEPVSRD